MSDRFSAHVRPVIHIVFYHAKKTIYTRNIDIAFCLAPLFCFGITGFCSTFFQYNILDTLNIFLNIVCDID